MTASKNAVDTDPDVARAGRGSMPGAANGVNRPAASRWTRRHRGGLARAAGALALAGALSLWLWGPGTEGEPMKPTWFAGYVDVTVSPAYSFEAAATKDVVLSFIVAATDDFCRPSWGTVFDLDEAETALKLDSRLAALVSRRGSAAISFGGALNTELASSCLDDEQLKAAYREVIDRYHPVALDFDLEGDGLFDFAAGERRARVIAALQQERGPSDPELRVWMTLPASPRGLTDAGITHVDQMLAAGAELAGVNVMTMNYGQSRMPSQGMLDASAAAAEATHDQLDIIYQRAGRNLSSQQLWEKIGVTPMIGQNDLPEEVFDLEAARGLRSFAEEKGIQRLSMWSLNRDIECLPAERLQVASPGCSGINQDAGQFAELLGGGLEGRMGSQQARD